MNQEKVSELEQFYIDAIGVCQVWRSKVNITKATPNELHLYNVFTSAKNHLSAQLACIQDVQGNYNVKHKN